jgi:hypothetical protein
MTYRTQDKVMRIMQAHGLYCVALPEAGQIGLTDNVGNVYDVVTWDGSKVIDDGGEFNLYDWLY